MKFKKIILLLIALQFFYALSNAQIKLVGNITTNGVASYPTHIDSLGRGGYMSLPTTIERDAIPNLRRKYGMLVFVQADGKIYKLNAPTLTNADWVELSFGSSGSQYTDALARSATSLTVTGSSGAATYSSTTGVFNIPNYTLAGLGGSPSSRTITINGTAQDLSADRSWSVGTVTDVNALTLGTNGTDITSSVANGTTTPTITLNIPTASATNRGALSAADFSTFNAKQSALTFSTGLTNTSNTITVNTSQNIATLSNLTSNGIVTTSGGGGTLSVTSTLPVANGGTGAITLTGILKGNGTSALTAATAGTDYQAPISLTTSGSGAATFSGTTLNIPTVSTSVNASSISGTIIVANGGTGATTLTGILKGNGTSAFTTATAGSDYQAPISLTTSGTGAATFSGTTLNIPTVSTSVNASSISGTIIVANGGTGATTLTGILKGNGTSALTTAAAGTDYQAPISLTTSGSGAATFSGTTLNIPSYTLSGLGGVPYTGATGRVNLGVFPLTLSGGLTIGRGFANAGSDILLGSNISFGYDALNNISSGNNNTAIGDFALVNTHSGSGNTAVGGWALGGNTEGNNNTALGYLALPSSNTFSNSTVIGANATVRASNTIQLGSDGSTPGTAAIENVNTSGTITAGTITYPNTAGTNGYYLTTNGSSTASWTAFPTSINASTILGTISISNGGTGSSTKNFVDLTTTQTVSGAKTFTDAFAGDNTTNPKISGFSANINPQTNTIYTLAASDNGKIITLNNSGSIALTLPVLTAGFNCMIIQSGAGVVTLTGSSTTISNKNSFTKTAGVNSVVTIIYLDTNKVITIGDMSN